MFSRIRETATILSGRSIPADEMPDVIFVEDNQEKPSKASSGIAAGLIGCAIAWIVATMVSLVTRHVVAPEHTSVSVVGVGTIIGAAAAVLIFSLCDRQIHAMLDRVIIQLRITERVAPYFGHRLDKAIQILKS